MTYPDTVADANSRPTAPTLLLRRLACPYRPHNATPGPDYNPFVTVDYLELHRTLGYALNDAADPPARRRSFGRAQPYAANALRVRAQQGQFGPWQHTFARHNEPARVPFDWLIHLDRPLISPMELLHVSAFKPHELTQEFQYDPLTRTFRHVAPWLDSDRRLYRAFEYLETLPRAAGMPVAPGGRVPGKININTIWDPETLLALCDPQPSNNFTVRDIHDPNDLDTVYARLLATRSPGLFDGTGLGPNDRPFLSLGVGTPPPGDGRGPHGQGLQDTLLRTHEGWPLFQPATLDGPNHHPYLRHQLLTKVFNHLTTRSNVFAVWLTVGYFEVTDDTTRPVKLGAEVGRAESRHVRHRMFAIVDRSVLTHHPGPQPRFDPRGDSPGTSPDAAPAGRQAVPYFSIIQ